MAKQYAYLQLGKLAYDEAYIRQKEMLRKRIEGLIPDTIIAVEHPPVLTIGRMGNATNILADMEMLAMQGVSVLETDRGGDITYHGPGQAVMYPILDLHQHIKDVHKVINLYEEAIIRALKKYGIIAERNKNFPGVWVDGEKIAAIGIGIKKWVTYHGISLNVDPELEHFSYIIPCGIRDKGVTSMAKLCGEKFILADVQKHLAECFAEVFELEEVTYV